MTENHNGTADDLKTGDELQDVELNLKEIDPDTATPEQVAQLIKYGQTAAAQKNHWKSKAIDPDTHKPYKELWAAAKTPSQPNEPKAPAASADAGDDLHKTVAELKIANEKRDFGYRNQLSPEETDTVYALAHGKGKKPEDILEDNFFKAGLDASRKAAQTAAATPGSSPRAPRVEGKTFKEMNMKDREKNFHAVVEASAQK